MILMRKLGYGLLAAVAVVSLWVTAVAAQGVQCGGSFVPSLNCTISGQWVWTQASPFVFEGTTANAFETTLAITDPTADRTITLPNASGTVLLSGGASTAGIRAGSAGFASGNTTISVTTGLSALSACSVFPVTSSFSNNDGFIFSTILTASAGRLDIYQWRTTGAAATNATLVSYICSGTS